MIRRNGRGKREERENRKYQRKGQEIRGIGRKREGERERGNINRKIKVREEVREYKLNSKKE